MRSASAGTFHLNVQGARSSFDVPNTLDQDASGQDQHQKITTFNVAPGYSRILGANAVAHRQRLRPAGSRHLHPSADPFADTPATMSQNRRLTNVRAVKVDVAYVRGAHNVKVGATIDATR